MVKKTALEEMLYTLSVQALIHAPFSQLSVSIVKYNNPIRSKTIPRIVVVSCLLYFTTKMMGIHPVS